MASDLSSQTIAFIVRYCGPLGPSASLINYDQPAHSICGGNMAAAIISGLVAKGVSKDKIIVSEPWDVNRRKMADLGVQTTDNNVKAATGANILILAVKPQVAKTVCTELASSSAFAAVQLPLLVSIAAGITSESLKAWTTTQQGRSPAIVRVMPNTPALVGEGASGIYASEGVSEDQKKQVTTLLSTVSSATEWVATEELIDVVTGLSGSGPAYFFAMVEHLVAAAVKLGLDEAQATRLAEQTCLGAGKMMVEATDPPSQLRKNVTSPNGTTQAALESLGASDFAGIVGKAVKAATDRGEELGRTLGNQ